VIGRNDKSHVFGTLAARYCNNDFSITSIGINKISSVLDSPDRKAAPCLSPNCYICGFKFRKFWPLHSTRCSLWVPIVSDQQVPGSSTLVWGTCSTIAMFRGQNMLSADHSPNRWLSGYPHTPSHISLNKHPQMLRVMLVWFLWCICECLVHHL
jgi:hypothetical protein